MIRQLKVNNFALIDDLDMTFEKGLSAMTGETGAGKSIILESLHLLFGKRSDATMIRYGATKATVFGSFVLNSMQQEALDLPEIIEIEREIDQQGHHSMRLNGTASTLSKIKDVMNQIGSIHTQNDTMLLMDKNDYLPFIDQVDPKGIETLHHQYLMKRSTYLEVRKHHEALKQRKNQSIEKKSFLEYQVEELSNYHLIPDEKQNLEDQIEKLKNFDRIMNHLKEAYELLSNENFDIDRLYEASKSLSKIAHLDPDFEHMGEQLSEAYYQADDVKSQIYQTIDQMDFDEKAFDQMQERLYDLIKVEQKYQKTINEIIDYLNEIQEELLLITDYDHYLAESKEKVNIAYQDAYQLGLKLSQKREKLARVLEKEVIKELKDLDLDKASFTVIFENSELGQELPEQGLDHIDFLISLNEGEPEKPLAKVASGGERARFMFALKTIDAKSNHLSLLVLDEIDIGISGKTAAKVAQKMQDLSKDIQLIVISHLPQVAARANHHYGIYKQKEKERMVTRILKLSDEERIEKIALMLSDEKLSHFAIEQAKMLLKK